MQCGVLTKGIDYKGLTYKEPKLHAPIRMVYTGKLIIGRWKALAAIARVLEKLNSDEEKICMDIYTTDTLSDKQRQQLNRNGCSIKGALSLEEVKKVQEQADILVFVESLEKRYRYRARLSFSTKLTDYMKAGKCIFVVGDANIAPIEYFLCYNSGVVATSYKEIEKRLTQLCAEPERIQAYGRKAFECGKAHRDAAQQKKVLHNAIEEVLCRN